MVERNAKGKEARQYFIKCERDLKAKIAEKSPRGKWTKPRGTHGRHRRQTTTSRSETLSSGDRFLSAGRGGDLLGEGHRNLSAEPLLFAECHRDNYRRTGKQWPTLSLQVHPNTAIPPTQVVHRPILTRSVCSYERPQVGCDTNRQFNVGSFVPPERFAKAVIIVCRPAGHPPCDIFFRTVE
jgi:hypothetical protein